VHELLSPGLDGYPFATFYIPIGLSALIGGFRASIVATLLSTAIVWYFFLPPEYSFRLHRSEAEALIAFVATGLFFGVALSRSGETSRSRGTVIDEVYWGAAPKTDA
jgi:K+-sensing histidine kinase KdpD